jgi:DNA-binding beta-propeller fold protein YncE
MKRLIVGLVSVLPLVVVVAEDTLGSVLVNLSFTGKFDASSARPGIAIGGVHFDDQNDLLILVGNSDYNTPDANLFRFDTAGSLLGEIEVGVVGSSTILAVAGVPNSQDLYVSQGSGGGTIRQITREGVNVRSRTFTSAEIRQIAGIAVHPVTQNIWVSESIGDTDFLYELHHQNFDILQQMSYASLFPSSNILGLDIDPLTGNFLATLGSHGNKIVEFTADLGTVVAEFSLPDPDFRSLTSLSIGHTTGRLYATSGSTDTVFEFTPIPEPSTLAIWSLLSATVAFGAWRRQRKR